MQFFLPALLFSCILNGQAPTYFQQDISYDMKVLLDDEKHQVAGDLTLTYTNNSPDSLPSIIFHLWPRAFSKPGTAYDRQKLRDGSTAFHFAGREDRGTLDSMYWKVDGIRMDIEYFPNDPDIATLPLPQPLAPGATATIETSFRTVIPKSWSRLGRVDQSYQLTQWYPKPAVYDREGWHPMPYLDRGEYYSEFGDFRVEITLPQNYLVAATGVLETEAERKLLLERSAADREELAARKQGERNLSALLDPPSSSTRKTLVYTAENVHDFAWFADKKFRVLHDTLHLRTRPKTVDVWSFFTETDIEHWVNSTDYLKRATHFYSDKVGAYPYPQVTGVQSALSAGGGMEYPMITVIGLVGSDYDLDEVLAHEVGHNWFYGILGSNERDHPWMDEGINSYYEGRYTETFYPEGGEKVQFIPGRETDADVLAYRYLARQGRDQAPNTNSDSMSQANYWMGAYSKPEMLLRVAALDAGTEKLDAAMQAYYEQWKFRHPQPEDFFASLAANGIDVETSLRPGLLTATAGEFNRKAKWTAKLPGTFLPSIGLATDQDGPGPEWFVSPLFAFNANDGFMAGAALHNRTLEPKRFEWIVAPLYGFGSSELGGFAGARLRLLRPVPFLRQVVVSAGTQRFSDFEPTGTAFDGEIYGYNRSALKVEGFVNNAPISQQETRFYTQYVRLNRDRPAFTSDGMLLADANELTDDFLSLGIEHRVNKELNPAAYGLRLEYKGKDESRFVDETHLRLEATVTGGYQYEADKFLRWRLFGGYFLVNDLRDRATYPASTLSLVDNAASDYRYDGLYLGRNTDGLYQQQLERRQGGFRAPIPAAFSFGRSNNYLTSLNVDADLPLPLPLGVFFDAGLYGFRPTTNSPETGEFNWVGGVSLSAFQGRVGVYLPLVADPDTKRLLEQTGDLLERASFRLNLSGWLPWRWVDGIF